MSNKSGSANDEKEHHHSYYALRSQLVSAIFESNSVHNGDRIYALLNSMRHLKDDSLSVDFARCEALVQQWKATWYPDFMD